MKVTETAIYASFNEGGMVKLNTNSTSNIYAWGKDYGYALLGFDIDPLESFILAGLRDDSAN